MSRLSRALIVLILITSLVAFVRIVVAANANFILQPQKEQVISLSLQKEDSVDGSFSVVSNDDTGINFYVIDPLNQTILRFDNAIQKSFSFIAQETGEYQMHFDNSVSMDYSKTVAVNYNATHYIMGLPQEQFLLIVIAIVVLIGVIAYVALMPK